MARYFTVTVSIDSLEWTDHWLPERRCDLLAAHISPDPAITPRLRLTAIESKARSLDEPIEVSEKKEPFADAIDQVVTTLDALEEILFPEQGASLMADLKLTAVFEHLASETLARFGTIHAQDKEAHEILKVLTALSKRELTQDDLALDGLVVVTQRAATVEEKSKQIQQAGTSRAWPIRLIRCGIPALRSMFEATGAQGAEPTESLTAMPPEPTPTGNAQIPEPRVAEPPLADGAPRSDEHGDGHAAEVEQSAPVAHLAEPTEQVIRGLEAASRLRRFKIEDVDRSLVREGPTLISIPVPYAAGESLRPIEVVTKDIARELGVSSVSVENDPDHPYHIRFLVPRTSRDHPPIPDEPGIFCDPELGRYFGFWLGANVDGSPYRSFLSEWPHLLVAGTTGSGKTTFLKTILTQLDAMPEGQFELVIVDGKGEYDYVDLVSPKHFPNKFPDVLLGHEFAGDVLEWLIEDEVAKRREALRSYFRENPKAPRSPKQAFATARSAGEEFPLHPIIVFIDEFAELMLASGSDARRFENLVQRTVQAGRSALVHLILATQRPDARVLQGAIKANLPTRVALQLPSHHDSMTILGEAGAEDLLGKGDLLFRSTTGARLRLQGYSPKL